MNLVRNIGDEMKKQSAWILFLMLPCVVVHAWPVMSTTLQDAPFRTSIDNPSVPTDTELKEKVIAVRITSSVAIARGNGKLSKIRENRTELSPKIDNFQPTTTVTEKTTFFTLSESPIEDNENENITTEISQYMAGANMEFIKQLNSKKQVRGLHNEEKVFSFPSKVVYEYVNDTDDSIGESSIKSVLAFNEEGGNIASEDGVPLGRSVPLAPSSHNTVQDLMHKPLSERGNTPILTTVSFNVLHDTPKATDNYNQPMDTFTSSSQPIEDSKFINQPPTFYNEPAKIYSKPSQVYSEPAKFYSEPAKIYSEPAKVYGEPAKVYSEPAKIYSEPAKFYSQPASLHLMPDANPSLEPWAQLSQSPGISSTANTTPISTLSVSSTQKSLGLQPEKNYEVDEKVSVLTEGRSHGVQEANPENCKQENCKVGYVVEGRQYRKYRVEERTSDGFIVGEYGVVRNEDGALRGVRYTADGDASPRLIYDALMKFLQLK